MALVHPGARKSRGAAGGFPGGHGDDTEMKPFVVNSHRRLVFPSNFFPEPDFSSIDTVEDLAAIVRRDFEVKAPTGSEIAARAESGRYANRYELLRDLGLHLFWMNRYVITMYEKRPTRWRDVPRRRDDVFLPALTPWKDGERKVAAVDACYRRLPAAWAPEVEHELFRMLFDVFRHKRHHATDLPAVKPTVAEAVASGSQLVYRLGAYDPDYPRFSLSEILDCHESVPELEALRRWTMTLHNQYPWDRSDTRLTPVGALKGDDVVVVYQPRHGDVLDFIRRVKNGEPRRPRLPPAAPPRPPVAPLAPVQVRSRFAVQPRLEALAVRRGEILCTNDDIIRNSASNWSPMSAAEIAAKTGIESRCYTEGGLEHLALDAAESALARAGRAPEEMGAVVFCTCTNTRLLPSAATWLSGQLGMFQTHASVDLVAACAGFPYGLADAIRILQEVRRPILLVCAEKFSDKVGSVRTSRMIFGDGAAALVVGPAPDGAPGDVDVVQTWASGPESQVNAIIWPNVEFGCDITVYGPEVKALVKRYLEQMLDELQALPHPDGRPGTLVDAVDLIIPHQANKRMVIDLAEQAGIGRERMYFNIARVGNTSAASIPLAIHDAVRESVLSSPARVFTPGFGAGAVAGYAVLRVDPAAVAPERTGPPATADAGARPAPPRTSSSADVEAAFGG